MNRLRADFIADAVELTLNGRAVRCNSNKSSRLAHVLRDELGLTGTKVGCDAGDCGACTVLLDGRQVCACLTPLAQAEGREITTIEGLKSRGELSALQAAFHRHGAAQCGACTPGMLMAAADLLSRNANPSADEVKDALGGVLCRCTGYQKIVEAVLDVGAGRALPPSPPLGTAVGARVPKVDGIAKLDGTEKYGADAIPPGALWLKVIRSPHHRARLRLGDMEDFVRSNPGVRRVFTAQDVPSNRFGIYPHIKDQPVFAQGEARFRGEAVAAVLATREVDVSSFPVAYEELPPIMGLDAAMAAGARLVQEEKPGNLLLDGQVKKGDARAALRRCAAVVEGTFETSFVEHAYIEPEA